MTILVAKPSRTARPVKASELCVRVQFHGSGFKPYGWEICVEDSDQVIAQSDTRFRKPGHAWTEGLAEMAQRYPSQAARDTNCAPLPELSVVTP